jgi:hypothetical protein
MRFSQFLPFLILIIPVNRRRRFIGLQDVEIPTVP